MTTPTITPFSGTATVNQTIPAPATGDTLLVMVLDTGGSGHTLGASASTSGTLTNITGTITGGSTSFALFAFQNCSSTDTTITITTSGSFCKGLILDYPGYATAGGYDGHASNYQATPGIGVGAISTGSFTTPTSGALIVSVTFDVSAASNTIVAASGTQKSSGTLTGNSAYCSQDQPNSVSPPATFTDATDGGVSSFATVAISLLPPGGGSSLMGQICL